MNKKVLIVASVISFIEWFNKENIEYLLNRGYEVSIACNLNYFEDTDVLRTKKYINRLKEAGVILHHVNFCRTPLDVHNVNAFISLRNIINYNNFKLIHVHTPTASILTRIAAKKARKLGAVVMYTSHGFHFHSAAPLKNWLLYYPIELHMSRYCDYIITINKEDYNRSARFKCPNVRYIPGVGVDLEKIRNCNVDRNNARKELGIPNNGILIISVGELIERKNHEVIIRALSKINNSNIFYAICGKGPMKDSLKKIAIKLGVAENVLFLGFRTDIPQLLKASDISAFPSRIEGLGLAGIEALAAGLPLISSNVHGILDYVIDGKTGFACAPDDVDGFANAIEILSNNKELRESMKDYCIQAVEPFSMENALKSMWNIYEEVLK